MAAGPEFLGEVESADRGPPVGGADDVEGHDGVGDELGVVEVVVDLHECVEEGVCGDLLDVFGTCDGLGGVVELLEPVVGPAGDGSDGDLGRACRPLVTE